MKNKVNVLYLCEGSKFEGAEKYAATLLGGFARYDDINLTCGLFYDGFYSYKGLLREQIEKHGFKVIHLHGKNNFKSIQRIWRIVHDNRIKIIHFNDLKSTVVGGIAGVFLRNVKTVATIHGLSESYDSMFRQIKYRVSLVIYYILLRFFIDQVICVSEDLKARLEKRIGAGRIQTIHNGLELNTCGGNQRSPCAKKNRFIVGTVGRLDKIKGHIFFLETAFKIIAKRDDVAFQIIGTGPLEGDLKKRANLLRIADKVHFFGFRDDVYSLIADMDIFVLSSLHEGIPFALLEAMALSKPVVCTEVGGIKEVIQNGLDGLLVPPEDPQALSQAILTLLNDPDYATKLGRNAKKKIETEFSSELMAEETYTLYSRLIERP